MQKNDKNQPKTNSIKIFKKNNSSTNLSLKPHLNKNIHKNIYSLFLENENSASKTNKEKRNLSQPKEKYKRLNIEKEENNIINDKKITLDNIPKRNILTPNNNILTPKEQKQITSIDKIIFEKEEDKNPDNSDLQINVPDGNTSRHKDNSSNKFTCSDCFKFLFKKCFSLIHFAANIAIVVIIADIYSQTGSNPLQNIILSNQNIATNSSTTITPNLKINKFNVEKGIKDVSNFKNIKIYLRYLKDNCDEFNYKINETNYEIDKAFNLRFGIIHKTSLGILIVCCLSFGAIILIIISGLIGYFCPKKYYFILAPLFVIIILITTFSDITNFILFIIMIINYYKGYATLDFLKFYEKCLDDDKKPPLKNIYNRLDQLNKNFIAFWILNIIAIISDIISSYCNKKDQN